MNNQIETSNTAIIKRCKIMAKKLTLSSTDKKIFGVCGGIAEYFDLDSSLVRIGYVFFTLFSTCFPGVLLYFVMWFVMPQKK